MSDENLFDDGDPIIMKPVSAEGETETVTVETAEKPAAKPTRKKRASKKKATVKKTTGIPLGIYKMHSDSHDILWATEGSVAFDVRAYLKKDTSVVVYNELNKKMPRPTRDLKGQSALVMNAGDRVLVPTGLIFDIPEGYSLRVHPRSGLSIKQGLTLANAEGVIDWDYTNELFVALVNNAAMRQPIFDGERIAQVELVKSITKPDITIRSMRKAPSQKTDRTGGIGHTGKK